MNHPKTFKTRRIKGGKLMELLIGIACIGATVYYFYLMANFFDTKIAMRQKERKRRANKMQLQMYKSRRRR